MRCSEQNDKVSAALVKVAKVVRVVGKSGDNKFDKYQYAKLEDYIFATSGPLVDAGLSIITSAESAESLPTRPTKNGGNEYPVRVKLVMRAVHESGQWMEVESIGEGQDRGDKGTFKAITGARKYGIACLLGLGTSDDPETDNAPEPPPSHRQVPKQDPKPVAETPKVRFFNAVVKWSGAAPEDRKAACAAVAKKCGVELSKATDAEYERMVSEVGEAVAASESFTDFTAENR